MMSIGAFARRTGLSVSALRFYGDRGLLAPLSVDASSGYRYYSEQQIPTAKLIRDLRLIQMPLAEIGQALVSAEGEREQLIQGQIERLQLAVNRARTIGTQLGVDTPRLEHDMSSTTLTSLDFEQALNHVLAAAGTDPRQPHLMCVLIEAKDGSLRFAATDSHRLAIRDAVPKSIDVDFVGVVAAATLAEWRDSLANAGDIKLELIGGLMKATGGGVELASPVVPTTFPDYESVLLPSTERTTTVVDRAEVQEALARMRSNEAVEMSISATGLEFRQGTDVDVVSGRGSGAALDTTLNPVYGVEALRAGVGAEVVVELEGALRPIIFRSADSGTWTSAVMPIDPAELKKTSAGAR